MDQQEFTKRLMATFLEELHEHVEAMNRELLALEKEPPPEQREEMLKVLFRSAHSLKGASRAVNVETIQRSCHLMEDILAEIRDGKRDLEPPFFELSFKFADGLQEAGMRLRDELDLAGSLLQTLLPQLETAAANEGPPVQGTAEIAPPSAADISQPPAPTVPAQPPAAAAEPAGRTRVSTGPTSSSIRVSAEKLDALLAQNGELLVARRRVEQRFLDAETLTDAIVALRAEWNQLAKPLERLLDDKQRGLHNLDARHQLPSQAADILASSGDRLTQLERQAERLVANMNADARVLRQTCTALDDEVCRVRMLPFEEACGGLQRAVHDIAHSTGKRVELVLKGKEVEVDRSVLEGLKDPLLHLVRNAVDHGIEPPGEREIRGKPPQGQITVSAALRGGHVEVVVQDDGRGFDLPRICAKGRQRGFTIPAADTEQARLVFLPGFSTASEVTEVSGRGVGLDVVQNAVHELHGSIDVDFRSSAGSRFTITVPLTLTTVRCVLANVADQTYAIPSSTVHQLVRFEAESIHTIAGRPTLLLGGTPTPVAALAEVLGRSRSSWRTKRGKLLAIVAGSGDQPAALVVDELAAEQQMLVKNLGPRIRHVRLVSGATLLPSGRVALVLNAGNVVSAALAESQGEFAQSQTETTTPRQRRLLLVEDSLTTRTLIKGILESAGYLVSSAADGELAWEVLTRTEVDLVVSDVDMPRLDGFDLTTRIRGSAKYAELPVILVTARATDEDKKRGLQVGANAYLAKSGFDQTTLLQAIEQFS